MDSRRLRALTAVDDCTREYLAHVADTSLSRARVAREPDAVIVSDNGCEFTSNDILTAAERSRARWHYSPRAKPMQNAFIESFNRHLRDQFMNETLSTLGQVHSELAGWRNDHNGSRPHSPLAWQTRPPFRPRLRSGGICRCARSPAPRQIPPQPAVQRQPTTVRWNSGLDKSWGQDQVTRGGSIHRTLRPRRRSGRSTAKQPMPLSSNGKAANDRHGTSRPTTIPRD